MPANVETAVYANTPAWHREGTVLDTGGDKGITVPVALKESGLNWEVAKVPIFGPNGKEIEGRWGVQRDTDEKILGVVGDTWQPTQNIEGFELVQDVLEQDEMNVWIEAAGALDGGKKVWILAHVDQELFIAGERIVPYLLFWNGHDGRTSVGAATTDVRVVCQNTLDMATGPAGGLKDESGGMRVKDGQIRVRHTVKATERITQAKAILRLRSQAAEELAKQGEWLVKNEMSDKAFNAFLETLMPIDPEQDEKPAGTMIRKRRDEVLDVYKSSANLNDIRGTRWGAYNAVVEYADYGRTFKDANTQMKSQFGLTPQPLKARAQEILLAK